MFKLCSAVLISAAIALIPAGAEAGISKYLHRSKAKTETKPSKVQAKQIARVERDVQRLESILAGVKTSAKLSDKSWKQVANEADTLANRIYANVKSATAEKHPLRAAEELRTHVKNMKKEVEQKDYRNTRRHAERALNVAARLDEWAG
ncbi:MAG TPA: hypothetical protein VGK31_10510 [Thermoanaerobaculia bacterium]